MGVDKVLLAKNCKFFLKWYPITSQFHSLSGYTQIEDEIGG
jgi:hypothetical protein